MSINRDFFEIQEPYNISKATYERLVDILKANREKFLSIDGAVYQVYEIPLTNLSLEIYDVLNTLLREIRHTSNSTLCTSIQKIGSDFKYCIDAISDLSFQFSIINKFLDKFSYCFQQKTLEQGSFLIRTYKNMDKICCSLIVEAPLQAGGLQQEGDEYELRFWINKK